MERPARRHVPDARGAGCGRPGACRRGQRRSRDRARGRKGPPDRLGRAAGGRVPRRCWLRAARRPWLRYAPAISVGAEANPARTRSEASHEPAVGDVVHRDRLGTRDCQEPSIGAERGVAFLFQRAHKLARGTVPERHGGRRPTDGEQSAIGAESGSQADARSGNRMQFLAAHKVPYFDGRRGVAIGVAVVVPAGKGQYRPVGSKATPKIMLSS